MPTPGLKSGPNPAGRRSRLSAWAGAVAVAAGWAVIADGLVLAAPAHAGLPEIRQSGRNRVPDCVTPAKLMAFVRTRNGRIEPRWRDLARHYQIHGEAWRVRWDYAFYQMLVETNYLTFRRPGGGMGDVHPRQNNFAGLGATGGVSGDSFATPSTGVLAQIQHLVVYSGQRLDNPTAPRTRLKMDEIVSKSEALDRPVTFQDLSGRWAVDRAYGQTIEGTAQAFRSRACRGPDRFVENTGASRHRVMAHRPPVSRASAVSRSANGTRATSSGKDERPGQRPVVTSSLRRSDGPPAARPAAPSVPVAGKIDVDRAADPSAMQAPAIAVAPSPPSTPPTNAEQAVKGEQAIVAPATAAATTAQPPSATAAASITTGAAPPRPDAKCKVFRASYGGPKTVLIESRTEGLTRYTMLEVTTGREQEQAKAFMDAHARGGKILGEFPVEADALKRTFHLCPAQ